MNLTDDLRKTAKLILMDWDMTEFEASQIAVQVQRNEIMAKPQPKSLADARIEQSNNETIERLMAAYPSKVQRPILQGEQYTTRGCTE